jgi:hypothetical protein
MPYLADALFGRCPIWPMPDARQPDSTSSFARKAIFSQSHAIERAYS